MDITQTIWLDDKEDHLEIEVLPIEDRREPCGKLSMISGYTEIEVIATDEQLKQLRKNIKKYFKEKEL